MKPRKSGVTWEEDCMILPRPAKPIKVRRRKLRLGIGRDAITIGNVAASHAALRI